MPRMLVNKPSTITDAVIKAFDSLKPGTEFSGLEFKGMCVKLNPALEFKYEDTFLRILRMKRRDHFICIKRSISKYKKIGSTK